MTVHSQAAVRRAIRRSPVPVRAWAEALGCTKRALYMLLEGNSRVLDGPLVDRAGQLLDALRDGPSHWRKVPTPGKRGHPTYRVEGEHFTKAAIAARAPVRFRIDPKQGTLAIEPPATAAAHLVDLSRIAPTIPSPLRRFCPRMTLARAAHPPRPSPPRFPWPR